jgi:hypothetical protein
MVDESASIFLTGLRSGVTGKELSDFLNAYNDNGTLSGRVTNLQIYSVLGRTFAKVVMSNKIAAYEAVHKIDGQVISSLKAGVDCEVVVRKYINDARLVAFEISPDVTEKVLTDSFAQFGENIVVKVIQNVAGHSVRNSQISPTLLIF